MSSLDLHDYAEGQSIKRGGIGLTFLVVVGGLLRFVSVSSSAARAREFQNTPTRAIETRKRVESHGNYLDQLGARIKESFPVGDLSVAEQQELKAHLNAPRPVRDHVRFVVAILPILRILI